MKQSEFSGTRKCQCPIGGMKRMLGVKQILDPINKRVVANEKGDDNRDRTRL